jgi:hypothetical protein
MPQPFLAEQVNPSGHSSSLAQLIGAHTSSTQVMPPGQSFAASAPVQARGLSRGIRGRE